MVRWSVLAAGATVVVGAAFVTGASIPPKPIVGTPRPEVKAVIGQKTGYFNMARVMRENKRAVVQVARISDRQKSALAQVKGLRAMQAELQKRFEADKDENSRYRISGEMRAIARMIEDFDREHSRSLNDRASAVISELYDEIRLVVVAMATENGLSAVLAYPDAVTTEELNNPMIKELKLKPPAAQPFYLDPSVDYTDELIQRLNARYAAETGEK